VTLVEFTDGVSSHHAGALLAGAGAVTGIGLEAGFR